MLLQGDIYTWTGRDGWFYASSLFYFSFLKYTPFFGRLNVKRRLTTRNFGMARPGRVCCWTMPDKGDSSIL